MEAQTCWALKESELREGGNILDCFKNNKIRKEQSQLSKLERGDSL